MIIMKITRNTVYALGQFSLHLSCNCSSKFVSGNYILLNNDYNIIFYFYFLTKL